MIICSVFVIIPLSSPDLYIISFYHYGLLSESLYRSSNSCDYMQQDPFSLTLDNITVSCLAEHTN